MESHKLGKGPGDQQCKAPDLAQNVLQLEEQFAKPHDKENGTVEARRETDVTKVKKFVEDEEREKGSVKLGTYRGYLNATGGLWILIVVVIAHVGYMASITGRVSPNRSRSLKSTTQVEGFHRDFEILLLMLQLFSLR